MKNNYYYLAGGLIIIAVLLLLFFKSDSTTQDTILPIDDSKTQQGSIEENNDENTLPGKTSGSYEIYTPQKVTSAEGNIVLFFHASWCPSCRGLNSNLEDNLDNIPSDLTILKVDYDTETQLKQKYGVTTQHTLVQVENNGNLIKKWSGGSTLDRLISQVE